MNFSPKRQPLTDLKATLMVSITLGADSVAEEAGLEAADALISPTARNLQELKLPQEENQLDHLSVHLPPTTIRLTIDNLIVKDLQLLTWSTCSATLESQRG